MPAMPTQPNLFDPDPKPSGSADDAPQGESARPEATPAPATDAPAGPMPSGNEVRADDAFAAAQPAGDIDDDAPGRQPPLLAEEQPPAVVQLRERRPLWAQVLGRLLRPWITLRIEPLAPQQFVDRRPVCYVLEDYGLSNALILDRACREHGMPSPLRPLPGDPLGRKRAYVALSRRSAGSTLNYLASAGQPAPAQTPSE
jgi:glycerol-3-phosphate O-acyltransferase